MYKPEKIKIIEDITQRLLTQGKVKNPVIAEELARRWVTAK